MLHDLKKWFTNPAYNTAQFLSHLSISLNYIWGTRVAIFFILVSWKLFWWTNGQTLLFSKKYSLDKSGHSSPLYLDPQKKLTVTAEVLSKVSEDLLQPYYYAVLFFFPVKIKSARESHFLLFLRFFFTDGFFFSRTLWVSHGHFLFFFHGYDFYFHGRKSCVLL